MDNMTESTEYLLHILLVHLDTLRRRMHNEQDRATAEFHYHYVINYVCDKPGCSGVDPILATYNILQEELASINKEFPHHILSASHTP